MLERVRFGGREYSQIYEEAQKLIPSHSGVWTNWNQSDPGITVLQSLALLSSKLDETAEATSEEDVVRLLELFGFSRAFARPARLILFLLFRESEILLKGTPFLLRDTYFEIEEEMVVHAGELTGIRYKKGEEERDVSSLIRAKSQLELFEDGWDGPVSINIVFSRGAKKGEKLRIYFESKSKFPRNKICGEGLPFAVITWEILGANGFVACETLDGTSCFTQSGRVEITLAEDILPLDGGYHIKATISRHEYDVAPVIGRIWGGHVELEQKQTLSRCLSFDSETAESLMFPLPFWGVEKSELLVLGRDESGSFRQYYPAIRNRPRSYSLTKKNGVYNVIIRCKKMPRAGKDSVRVIIRRPEALPDLNLGSVTGYDGQRFKPEWRGAYPADDARLMIRQKYDGQTVYEDVDSPGCNVFCDIAPDGEVTVRHAATDGNNTLFFSQLALTLGERGNLSKRSLEGYSPGGFGGKDPDDLAESISELIAELEFPHIAVTMHDYERLALETPGLSLESASARRNENGIVRIAVKPYSDAPRPALTALQTGAIAKYLDERRILNSKIEIVSPDWIPIEIEAEVSVYPQAVSPEQQISDAIINGVKWGEFGAALSYGKINMLLDELDCVESVSRLIIRAAGAADDNIRQNFDSIFYLENLYINYETRV